jgi:hypothetical protein
MSEMSIGTVISDEWFQDQEKRQSIERKMYDALPDDAVNINLSWSPLVALDQSGDTRWSGRLSYNLDDFQKTSGPGKIL